MGTPRKRDVFRLLRTPACGLALAWSLHSAPQQSVDILGAYAGQIGTMPATLHLRLRPDGRLTATLDHLDPAAPWMFTCADVVQEGDSLAFSVPSVGATWKGTFSDGKRTLAGLWTQKGTSLAVAFRRDPFTPSTRPSALDGIWLGMAQVAATTATRLQVVFRSDSAGREYCTVDALDLYTMDLECANVTWHEEDVSFDIPVAGTHWTGKLSRDGNSLSGSTRVKLIEGGKTRDLESPLNLERQSTLSLEKARPGAIFDPALPRVEAAQLESVLDRDLAQALRSGDLAPATGSGVAIAVYVRGVTRVFSYGQAKADSIFEIGSVTKAFTGLLLAQMVCKNKVSLAEPVRELLPAGTVGKPAGPEITLLDLATQRSGLPAMPDNMRMDNIDNPYADYHVRDLLGYVGRRGVLNAAHAPSSFGSLGVAVLGVALAQQAGASYAQLIRSEIAGPLGMDDTVPELTPAQQARLLPGHDQFHGPARPWDSDALAPALALRSTAGDMLTFLIAHLHPDQIQLRGGFEGTSTLPAAIRLSLEPRAELTPGHWIALGWLYETDTGNYWHNGATAAYSSYAFFNPRDDVAAVVLLNASPGTNGSFVENLGRHISQRLAGRPAIALNP